jgi:hypothetical protein
MIRLVVAGTRDAPFEDIPIFIAAIRRWISRNGRPTHIVCGGNNPDKTLGADLIGAHLALKAGVRIDYLPADWTRGGTVECDQSAGGDAGRPIAHGAQRMTRLYPLLPWALCVLGAYCVLRWQS